MEIPEGLVFVVIDTFMTEGLISGDNKLIILATIVEFLNIS